MCPTFWGLETRGPPPSGPQTSTAEGGEREGSKILKNTPKRGFLEVWVWFCLFCLSYLGSCLDCGAHQYSYKTGDNLNSDDT